MYIVVDLNVNYVIRIIHIITFNRIIPICGRLSITSAVGKLQNKSPLKNPKTSAGAVNQSSLEYGPLDPSISAL